jgi:ubiquinone/menaquinone biosynthesis C-methylase UbiE
MNTSPVFTTTDWSKYATCYDTLLELDPYRSMLAEVWHCLQLQPTDKVLDVGCGTGNLLKHIIDSNIVCQLTGIDLSTEMINRAINKCLTQPLSLNLVQADINQNLPYREQTFSKLACVNALYTFTDPVTSLREMHRVLQPGGSIVVVTPKAGYESGLVLKAHAGSDLPESAWIDAHSSPEREEKLIRQTITDDIIVEQMLYVARHNRHIHQTKTFHFFSPSELREIFTQTGFTVLSINPTYAEQGILICARKEK